MPPNTVEGTLGRCSVGCLEDAGTTPHRWQSPSRSQHSKAERHSREPPITSNSSLHRDEAEWARDGVIASAYYMFHYVLNALAKRR